MSAGYEDEPLGKPSPAPEDAPGPEAHVPGGEQDSATRRAGWLGRILLILLAMAMVPWLLEQCQDPDRRLPVREAPPTPGADGTP